MQELNQMNIPKKYKLRVVQQVPPVHIDIKHVPNTNTKTKKNRNYGISLI